MAGFAPVKTVFITGAAQGIGLATAKHFASLGYLVGLYDINVQAVRNLASSGELAGACHGLCDVTDRRSVANALAHFAGVTGGRMDVLVNNAGTLAQGAFEAIDPEEQDLMIDVNVRGLTEVARAAFPLLRDTPNATLVNLCSLSSVHGVPGLAVYSATKFYVNGLTEALSLEWEEHGIRVTCVKPPVVDTAMGARVNAGYGAANPGDMSPETVARAIQRAVEGDRDGYVLGFGGKTWYWLDRLSPERVRRALTRRLVGQKSAA